MCLTFAAESPQISTFRRRNPLELETPNQRVFFAASYGVPSEVPRKLRADAAPAKAAALLVALLAAAPAKAAALLVAAVAIGHRHRVSEHAREKWLGVVAQKEPLRNFAGGVTSG